MSDKGKETQVKERGNDVENDAIQQSLVGIGVVKEPRDLCGLAV